MAEHMHVLTCKMHVLTCKMFFTQNANVHQSGNVSSCQEFSSLKE